MFLEYFKWHYGRGFNELIGILRNFFSFLVHFFSLKLLLQTFFSPWKRMSERYERGLHIESMLETFLVNLIMRAVGTLSRLIIILAGLGLLIIFMILSFFSLVLWLFLPLILLGFLLSSFYLIYASI
ncbi:MAG: hypothetical protein AAB861_01835 [Patescibacteria group bacterium]